MESDPNRNQERGPRTHRRSTLPCRPSRRSMTSGAGAMHWEARG
jgi:hypothetical protein